MAHLDALRNAAKMAEWIREQNFLKQRLVLSDSFPWVVSKGFGYGAKGVLEGGDDSSTDDRPSYAQNLTGPTSKPENSQNLTGPIVESRNQAGSKMDIGKIEDAQNFAGSKGKILAESTSNEDKIVAGSKSEDDMLEDARNLCDEANIEELRYIGGMDLSFVKEDETVACSALVVIDARTMDTVYEDLELVALDMPYIPGFLAFRESPALLHLLARMKSSRPDLFPQLLMIDGNGVLHPREFGLASHLGVVADVPTLGIAKTLFEVDGLDERSVKREARKSLLRAGDAMDLIGRSGKIWGSALRSTQECVNPVFVSIGHRISLETGIEIVRQCCKFRVPEPVRRADKLSRDYLRQHGVKG